jgi:RNA polymerase sigma factor (sigma-70 family)
VFRVDPLANPEALIRRVYAYAAYRLGDGPDAEDATSDAFERALRYRRSYDPSKGEPVGWLLGIARRCVDDCFARRAETVAATPDTAAPGNLEQDTAQRLEVGAAVALLDERDRELIALRYGADLTALQIGRILGLKTNAVEVALHRALARLRAALEPEDGGAQSGDPEPTTNPVRI